MKNFFLVVFTVLVGATAMAETVVNPATGNHSNPGGTVSPPPVVQPPPVDRNAKLFQYMSACLVERPGTGGGLDETIRRALTR